MAAVEPLDLFAGVCSAAACVALGLRANLLKKEISGTFSAPWAVWASLWFLAAICGASAVSLLGGPGMKPAARAALIMAALAVSSVVMLVNLVLQRPPAAAGAAEAGAPAIDVQPSTQTESARVDL